MAIQILTAIFIVGLLILAGALYFLFAKFDKQPPAYRWLTYTLLFSFSCDMLSVALHLAHANSNIGGTLYSIGFVSFFSVFFYYVIGGKRVLRYLIGINIAYFIFVIYNAIYIQKLTINSYSSINGAGLILTFCVLYYFKLLRELPAQQVYHLPLFWVISAMFFAKSGKLVLYTVIQYLTAHYNDNLIKLWMAHNSLTIVENGFIAYGAWLQYRSLRGKATA